MFADQMLSLMKEKNISRKKISEDIGFGINQIKYWQTHGTTPSADVSSRIADSLGVTVDYLLGKEDARPAEPRQNLDALDAERVYSIPLFENASAGFGAYAANEIVDYIPLYFNSATEAQQTICIRVRGDSMSPKIEDGDVIQVRKQDEVNNGAIAVVLLDGDEGLVKHVMYGTGWLELRSLNPLYKPMRFNGAETLRVRTVGLVTKIIKNVSGQFYEAPAPAVSDSRQALNDLLDQLDEEQLKLINAYIDFIADRNK